MDTFNRIASEFLKVGPEMLRDDLTPADVPGWDSMNYLLFIAELEKEYGLSFTMDEVMNATCLGDVKKGIIGRGIEL